MKLGSGKGGTRKLENLAGRTLSDLDMTIPSIQNRILSQAIRAGVFSIALLLGVASASDAAQNTVEFAKVAEHFRSACPASLSEQTFRNYYADVGATVKDINDPNLPFAVGAVLPGQVLMGTYYRKPVKCCVSMLTVDHTKFASELARRLNLQGRTSIQTASKKSFIVFKPLFANRLISIDWDLRGKGRKIAANICQTEWPGAEAAYQKYIN